MSIRACLPGLVSEGKVDPDTAERMGALFDDLEPVYRRQFGDQTAAAMASKEVIARMERETLQRRRRAVLQRAAEKDVEKWLRGGGERWGGGDRTPTGVAPGAGEPGPINPKAARTLLVRMDAQRRALEQRAFSMIDGILARHRRNVVGKVRHQAELDEIGRAAFGEKVDSVAAVELADAWLAAAEMLRKRANAAGANIGKLERWGLPQGHDSRAVAEAGFERWRDDIAPLLDPERMLDEATGFPFSPQSLELGLRAAFETIASDGMSKAAPGTVRQSRLTGGMDAHRFLIFKDYDSWAAYQSKYGHGTAYDAMLGHIHGLARAVAAMETLGPNPAQGLQYLSNFVLADPRLNEPGMLRAKQVAEREAAIAGRLWDGYTGALRAPENAAMATAFGAYRAVQTSSKLGSAFITAQSDHGFDLAARRFNGLPAVGMMSSYLKGFLPGSQADRQLAARIAYTADTWTNLTAGQMRMLGEEIVGERSRWLAETVIRASGLAFHTDSKRAIFALDVMDTITAESSKRFDQLDPAFAAMLERYGIAADGWEAIRRTPLQEDAGRHWIKVENIENAELGDRILRMIHSEADFAVPVPNLETTSLIDANVRRGTFIGEAMRSGPLKFKTFTATVMLQHGTRMLQQGGFGGKAGFLLANVIPLTLFGALGLQMYELANGRDVRPMDPNTEEGRKFWGNALIRSGGLTILGDLVGIAAGDRDARWAEFYGGPLGGDIMRFYELGQDWLEGDDRAAWKTLDWLGRQVPGNNIWYSRLAVDRLLSDLIQQQVDPDFADGQERLKGYAEEAGTGYWWQPGEAAPERAPDLGNGWSSGER